MKKRYRVLQRFSYPTKHLDKLAKGEKVAYIARKSVWAEAGEIVELPPVVAESALNKGWIEEIANDKT